MTCDLVCLSIKLAFGKPSSSKYLDLLNSFAQDRPCQRCIKRSIGHLCHDEPRDSMRAQKAENGYGNRHTEGQIKQEMMQPNALGPSLDAQQDKQRFIQTVEGQISSGPDLPSTFITRQLPPASSYEAQGGVYGIGTQQSRIQLNAETFRDSSNL